MQGIANGSVRLNLACALVNTWFGAGVTGCMCAIVHLDFPKCDVATFRLPDVSVRSGDQTFVSAATHEGT